MLRPDLLGPPFLFLDEVPRESSENRDEFFAHMSSAFTPGKLLAPFLPLLFVLVAVLESRGRGLVMLLFEGLEMDSDWKSTLDNGGGRPRGSAENRSIDDTAVVLDLRWLEILLSLSLAMLPVWNSPHSSSSSSLSMILFLVGEAFGAPKVSIKDGVALVVVLELGFVAIETGNDVDEMLLLSSSSSNENKSPVFGSAGVLLAFLG